eukprot:1160204-Pelagomonas_calceolata.AAC.4
MSGPQGQLAIAGPITTAAMFVTALAITATSRCCPVITAAGHLLPLYIHFGADEVPKTRWARCTACQARMRQSLLDNSGSLDNCMACVPRSVTLLSTQLLLDKERLKGLQILNRGYAIWTRLTVENAANAG